MSRKKILVIEDNADTRRFLEAMLSKEFDVLCAENGVVGIEMARKQSPNLILLDIMMPVLSGYDACSLLKKDERTKRIPIIFLSAKNSVNDITQGLTQGADDYIPKPFDYKELMARIQTRLRKAEEGGIETVVAGDLVIDISNREVTYDGKKATLTLTEYDLLRFLVAKTGTVVSREDLLKEVWRESSSETNDRTIDVHIRSLRKKIPALTRHIISIYGVGYKYEK
jgi:DNA-binding response OmpR family regulator